MKSLLFIAALVFTWLPASAAPSRTRARSTVNHSSRRSSSHSFARSIAKNSNHLPDSTMRVDASLRTASFRIPARLSPQASTQSSTPAPKSPAAARKKTIRKKRVASRTPVQKAPTPERISEIQSALARGGYYQNDPNGKWDGDTVGALQKFQSANGLEPTGKLDALSLQKMGLGSEIAGVSAPRPIVHPSPVSSSVASAAGGSATGSTSAPAGGVSPVTPGGGTPPVGGTPPSDAPQQ
jgi:hypothetical protein